MQLAVARSKIEFDAEARIRNLGVTNRPAAPRRAANSLVCPPPVPPSSPFPVQPRRTSLISGIDRKYKVVILELMYLTLAAYRKVPPRSAKWIREREWIAGYTARRRSSPSPSSFFLFLFFFLFSCSLRTCGKQKQAGGAARRGSARRSARLHKYYANIRSGPVTTARADARDRYVPPFLRRAAPQHSQSVVAYFHREICATRVSPLSPRDSWHFAYAA